MVESYLRDTLAVLSAVQNSPSNATGVLSLQEQRLGLAILETEDLAVATDIDFTLQNDMLAFCQTQITQFHVMVFPSTQSNSSVIPNNNIHHCHSIL